MNPKTERFEMRFDEATIEALDRWCASQDPEPSRSEAVRRLIEVGLSSKRPVTLTDGERLIIEMLSDVSKHLKVRGEIDPKLISRVLYGGHYWALQWELSGLFHGHVDDYRMVTQVTDILDMWMFIESAVQRLSAADKKALKEGTDDAWLKFSGFDGNNESTHYAIARFMVDDLGRFTYLKGRDLNSHSPTVARYSAMVRVFEPIRATLGAGRELGVKHLIDILNAQNR